jgi:general secretion pathway protein C
MPTVDQRIPPLLAMATALAMLAVTGWQGYEFWQTESGPGPLGESVNTVPEPQSRLTIPDVSLAELPLFGDAQAIQPQTPSNTRNLPETNLSLVLRGAMAAGGDYPASALVEGPEGGTEVYQVGDRLPGNALLRTVLPNRIIIERGGKLENLYFPETEATEGLSLTRENQPEPETIAPPEPQQDEATSNASPGDQNRRDEIRRRLEERRQELQENN